MVLNTIYVFMLDFPPIRTKCLASGFLEWMRTAKEWNSLPGPVLLYKSPDVYNLDYS